MSDTTSTTGSVSTGSGTTASTAPASSVAAAVPVDLPTDGSETEAEIVSTLNGALAVIRAMQASLVSGADAPPVLTAAQTAAIARVESFFG